MSSPETFDSRIDEMLSDSMSFQPDTDMNDVPTESEFRPEVLFRRPDFYLLEFRGPNALFVQMTRETYRRSIFTDRQRIVAASPRVWEVPVDKLMSQYESQNLPQPPLGYIFHVAHCGSTLLARALDHSSQLLVYREPPPLRQLAVEFAATPDGAYDVGVLARRLQLVTALLGRTYESSQTTIVKANVPVNFILPQLMELNPDSSGILLYATLRGYLLSVLKSPEHQQWVIGVVRELAGGIKRIELLADVKPETLSPAKAAACLWLAQILNYRQMVKSTDRVRTLDCETLFDRPADTLEAAFALFGVELAAKEIRNIVSGDLFSHHAKLPGFRFDNTARKEQLDQLADTLGDQIKEGTAWLSEVMAPQDIQEALPNPLVG